MRHASKHPHAPQRTPAALRNTTQLQHHHHHHRKDQRTTPTPTQNPSALSLDTQGAQARGDWYRTKDILVKGRDWIIDQIKKWVERCAAPGGGACLWATARVSACLQVAHVQGCARVLASRHAHTHPSLLTHLHPLPARQVGAARARGGGLQLRPEVELHAQGGGGGLGLMGLQRDDGARS